jgi:predicted MPP superfamily phosphohydrolase
VRRLAADLGPDLIVFTGDQLDRRRSDADRFVAGYSGFEAPLGVWGVLGNHDHATDPDLAVWALKKAGIGPLVNRSVTFTRGGSTLALTGVDDLDSVSGAPDFTEITRQRDAFRICLCHQPNGWHRAVQAGAHLTLSGHTHGGQIALTTRYLNMARLGTRYIAGPYRREDAFLYVSRGIGVGALPVRFGAPPEIDLITLRSAATSKRHAA